MEMFENVGDEKKILYKTSKNESLPQDFFAREARRKKFTSKFSRKNTESDGSTVTIPPVNCESMERGCSVLETQDGMNGKVRDSLLGDGASH